MKQKLLIALAGLALLLGGLIATWPGRGRAQDRGQEAITIQQTEQPGQPGTEGQAPQAAADVDVNEDIKVTPAQGQWLICVMTYTGPEAPRMARQMVTELRGPNFNLPAYVFNHGAEARRKERERIQEIARKQRALMEQFHQTEAPVKCPIRVATVRIEDQCAVLVGSGCPDMESAHRELDKLRQLKPDAKTFPQRVKLAMKFIIIPGQKPGEQEKGELVYVNPFQKAFVVHNPTVEAEKATPENALDISVLRKLNVDECYSLLNCQKPVTLIVSQHLVPSTFQQPSKPGSFWNKIGLGGDTSEARVDAAAHSAHNLAEQLLTKLNMEAYVLHTKCCSLVTIGSYDSANDPRLKRMQQHFAQLNENPGSAVFMRTLELLQTPVPMQVPH